jgi:putative restriction endonuclease
MVYLEMSRDESHGGGSWGFTNCVWSPTRKENGAKWPFWSKVLEIEQGDVIIHLRGVQPHAQFVGYSVAETDGFETRKRPPDPGQWGFSENFNRADLRNFIPFHNPILLTEVFDQQRNELRSYFDSNKLRKPSKNIFYVWQNGQLQCLNGGYLSEVDDELFNILFPARDLPKENSGFQVVSVETAVQIRLLTSRIGQSKFSSEIKKAYGNRCCFPGCNIQDSRFLVGAHIARWSDNEKLRGQLGNGLCLCLMHDRAFELGIFTLDDQRRIFVNPRQELTASSVIDQLVSSHGQKIGDCSVKLLDDALLEHWIRTDIDPIV